MQCMNRLSQHVWQQIVCMGLVPCSAWTIGCDCNGVHGQLIVIALQCMDQLDSISGSSL